MENERSHTSGFSAIGITAAISVFVLVAAFGWEIRQTMQGTDTPTPYAESEPEKNPAITDTATIPAMGDTEAIAPSPDGFSSLGIAVVDELITKYASLQDQGLYTEEIGQKVAEKMAATLKPAVSYDPHAVTDILTDTDTSYDRMLQYRSDLRGSLAPLLKNTQPEFEIFAYYVDTKDEKYLTLLKEVAQNYRDAASRTARVIVPHDAVREHVAILNAMEQFAAMLDAMVANAADPFASVALLRTYNQAEADMLLSFKALTVYYKQKSV
ncbi:MAG: hypothetical protein AAB804_03275 [Patescibacteria group bacterium]